MANKFKVGDVVRTVKGMALPRSYTITNGDMLKGEVIGYWGDEIKIKVLNHKEKSWIGKTYVVRPNYFEVVKPETIVIYRKDDKVYALDKATGKKVCAKCHPEDEFDFNKGAEIAFNRLMGKEPEKPKEEVHKFNIGDKVLIKNAESIAYGEHSVPDNIIGYVVGHHRITELPLIDFKVEYPGLHNGNGNCKELNGAKLPGRTAWYVLPDKLKKV